MTPANLDMILSLAVMTAVGVSAVVWSLARMPRAWVAARSGHPTQAVSLLVLNSVMLYAITQFVPAQEPGWRSTTIVCDALCGWNYFYFVSIWALTAVSDLAMIAIVAAAYTTVFAVWAWLDHSANPDDPDPQWAEFTRRQALRRQLGVTISAQRLAHALSSHLGMRAPHRWHFIEPDKAASSFLISPTHPKSPPSVKIDLKALRQLTLRHKGVASAEYGFWDPQTAEFQVVAESESAVASGQRLCLRVMWHLSVVDHPWRLLLPSRRTRRSRSWSTATEPSPASPESH
ncbi:Uncharacterised protein [Mycolicibacterium fortuitum]|uniref:Uncharacterized protein n=1 Tax=Mycolicibacterium fortuitum TaxID=1766 RepID=A0A378WFA5_MYCFO|nr:Uncharacterised protein [Mycolicibacterium fortuitum]